MIKYVRKVVERNGWKVRKLKKHKLKLRQTGRKENARLSENLRNLFRKIINPNSKNYNQASINLIKILGCSGEEARKHIEKQFKPGMTWKNYGLKGWHIDHIKPLCNYDMNNKADILICFHYTNLQPLWAHENISKAKKIIKSQKKLE